MGAKRPPRQSAHDVQLDEVWRENRPILVDLAFRMMGTIGDAEDLVQEAFARLLVADLDEIDDVRGWLVVVVSRLCLDALGSARMRRAAHGTDVVAAADASPVLRAPDPADRVTLDDSVRFALLVVLQGLSPAERTVFVLHDVFQFSFEAIAPIVGRTEAACRKLASRARTHVASETGPARFSVEPLEHRRIAEGFIAACAGGDIGSLMRLLDPDVVGTVDFGHAGGERPPVHGSDQVSANLVKYFGGARGVTLVSQPINGHAGALAFHERELIAVLVLKVERELIVDIHAVADPRKFALLNRRM
jgi:RNA polymerase sigma-70 factor (ECF subfamily)